MITNIKKITIAHIDLSSGGVEVFVRNIVENIDSNRFRSAIISTYKQTSLFYNNNNEKIKVYKIAATRDLHLIYDFVSLFQIILHVLKIKPNILHCHSAKGGFLGRLVGKMFGITTIYTPHAFSFLSTDSKKKRTVYLLLEKVALRWTHLFIACSTSESLRGINEVGFTKDQTFVWGNPIKLPECKGEFSCNDKYACIVGRPCYQKNLGMLASVLYKLKKENISIRCFIIGAGHYSPEKGTLTKLINEFGLTDKTELLDWIPHSNILPMIKNALFIVSTSRYEGLPLSLVEAMALGKPVIATDVDGNKDCIIDGYNGYLVPLDNIDYMAEKMKYLIENSDVRKEFGQNSLIRYEQYFNITKMIHKLEDVYIKANKG